MAINVNIDQFSNMNLGPVIQQFQVLNVQVQGAQDNMKKLETATKSLDSKGMTALSGTIGSVLKPFSQPFIKEKVCHLRGR